jgi:hypothetical protein
VDTVAELTTSRGRIAGELAGVRNRVAHAGYRPTREEAQAALQVAIDVVGEVSPVVHRAPNDAPE